jgi:protein-disulfide isomerase/uncharacterized membrane protein YphA (DoxX/SURF4 family)
VAHPAVVAVAHVARPTWCGIVTHVVGQARATHTDNQERPSGWLPWVSLVTRVALAATWFYSAVAKMAAPETFIRAIRAYRLVPESWAVPLGYGVPVLELVMGIFFLVGFSIRASAVISCLRIIVFTTAIVSAWARGLQIDCGCFGGGGFATQGTQYLHDVVRNALLLAMTVFLIWRPSSPFALDNVLREWHGRQSRRRRHLFEWGGTAVLIIAFTVIGAGLQVQTYGSADPNADQPVGTVDKYLIPRGTGGAPVTITIIEDFQCPNCRLLEQVLGKQITTSVDNGTALVLYRLVTYLNDASTTNYSSRAANAAACVQDLEGTDAFVRMHDTLYEHQPPEGSAGLTNDQLIAYAAASGARLDPVTACINQDRFGAWAAASTDQASKDAYTATPTLLVNGTRVDLSQDAVGAFEQAISTARGGS